MKTIYKVIVPAFTIFMIIFFISVGCETFFNNDSGAIQTNQTESNLQFNNNQQTPASVNSMRGIAEVQINCSELCTVVTDDEGCSEGACYTCLGNSNYWVTSCSNSNCPEGCQGTMNDVTITCNGNDNDDPHCPDPAVTPSPTPSASVSPTAAAPANDTECNLQYPNTIFRCSACIGSGHTSAACVEFDPALKRCSGGNLGHQGCGGTVCCGSGVAEDIPAGDQGGGAQPTATPTATQTAAPTGGGECKCDAYNCGQKAYNSQENKCVPCEAQGDGTGKWNWDAATTGNCDSGSAGNQNNNGGNPNNGGNVECKCDAYSCGQKGYNAQENKCVPCDRQGDGTGSWNWGAATDGPC